MFRINTIHFQRIAGIITVVIVIVLLFAFVQSASAVGGGSIEYGDTVSGYLDNNEYNHFWHFYGSAGDVITILMHTTSGNLDAYVDLWFSGGGWEVLYYDDDSGGSQTGNNLDAAIYSYQLPYDGEYAIGAARVEKQNGSTSGHYELNLWFEYNNAGGTSGGSSQSQSNEPVPYDYFEESGCPTGGYCLTSGSFAWPTASASYCVVSSSGKNMGGMDLWGDNTLQSFASNGANYWLSNTGFNLYESTDCNNSNIVLGWATNLDGAPLGSAWINQYTSDQQIIIALNYGSGGVVYDPNNGNVSFHWNPHSGDGQGYDGSLVMAHELGHAIGIGHDVQGGSGNLMYPNATPGATYNLNYSLGQDSLNELLVKYPSLAAGGVNQYQKVGVSGAYLTSENGRRASVQVPIPDGLENRLYDLRAGCAVVGYLPDGDDDVAFQCTWDLNSAASGQVTFYLDTSYSDHSTVTAYALVWDANVFPQQDGISFRMDSQYIWITDMNNNTYQYDYPYKHYFNMPPYSTLIVLINGYETNESDTQGWSIINNGDGSWTFYTNNGNSWDGTSVQGHIQVLGWTGNDSVTNQYTGRNNNFGVNARIDLNYYQICANYGLQLVDSGLVIWEPSASAMASMVEYWTGGDKDYGASNLLRAESGTGGNTNLKMEFLSEDGNGESCVTWQNTLFQVGP